MRYLAAACGLFGFVNSVSLSDIGRRSVGRTYSLCQVQTPGFPLLGCPKGTILVGPSQEYTSIQEAILSLPADNSSHVILIQPGTYEEQLNVTRPGPLTLLGSTSWLGSDNQVTVTWSAANHDNTGKTIDNYITSVLTVAPTMNASLTGNGPTGFAVPEDTPFGSSDFRAYNIDFVNGNEGALQSNGPAHAVGVSRANAGFYSCGFYSYQDTVYIGKLGNAYFHSCEIAGQTDFLYGFGTAWIEESNIILRGCGGGITAWKGTNTTFENKYGVYISDSSVQAANNSIAEEIADSCPLGRPWNSLHRSIFMKSYFDDSILPAGYILWGDTDPRYDNSTFMAVYNDYGPGWDKASMEESNVTIVLDKKGVAPYDSPRDVFITEDGEANVKWIDSKYL